jgi:hypothetical protein
MVCWYIDSINGINLPLPETKEILGNPTNINNSRSHATSTNVQKATWSMKKGPMGGDDFRRNMHTMNPLQAKPKEFKITSQQLLKTRQNNNYFIKKKPR